MTKEVVLLAGSTGAVGRVVAKTLYDAGYLVALTGRNIEEITRLNIQLGERAFPVYGSLDTEAAAGKLVREIFEKKGRIDVVVSTVGGIEPTWPSLHEASDESILKMLSLNLMTPLRLIKAATSVMKPGGRIALISSRSGVSPQRGPYDLSKGALQNMLTIFAAELKPKGIRINAVAPSTILTEANKREMPDADTSTWVKPEEIANALLYLVSSSSAGITGTTLPMFGS